MEGEGAQLQAQEIRCGSSSVHKKNTNKAFGGALLLRDYNAVNRKYQLQEFAGYPYSLCAHYCTRMVRSWQTKNSVKDVIFMFEKGDEHQGDLDRLCKPDGVNPRYPTKLEAVPCQAADLLAWRTRYGFEAITEPNSLEPERANQLKNSFSEAWSFPHAAFYGDRERLDQLCIDVESLDGRRLLHLLMLRQILG